MGQVPLPPPVPLTLYFFCSQRGLRPAFIQSPPPYFLIPSFFFLLCLLASVVGLYADLGGFGRHGFCIFALSVATGPFHP